MIDIIRSLPVLWTLLKLSHTDTAEFILQKCKNVTDSPTRTISDSKVQKMRRIIFGPSGVLTVKLCVDIAAASVPHRIR